jgi:hypothetical protein
LQVDIGYATALLEIPENAPFDWIGARRLPDYPRNKRATAILPVRETGGL